MAANKDYIDPRSPTFCSVAPDHMAFIKIEVTHIERVCAYDSIRPRKERSEIEREYLSPLAAAYDAECKGIGWVTRQFRWLWSDLIVPIAFVLWMVGGFLFVPLRHAVRAVKLYSLALTRPQLVARVTSQAATLFVLFSAGYLGYLIFLGSWAKYAFLLAPLAGLSVAKEIGKRVYKIPVNETLGTGPVVPHRYRNLSQQVIFEQALEHYEKQHGDEKVTSPESPVSAEQHAGMELDTQFASEAARDKTKFDPVARAMMVASYVEEVGKSGWVRLPKEQAQRHELYYDHPPLKNLLLILLAMLVLQGVVQTGATANPWARSNIIEPIRVVAGVLFGAAFAPPRIFSAAEVGNITAALLCVPFVYMYGGKLGRVVITACLGYYLFCSVTALPSFIEDWNAVPWVQGFQTVFSWTKIPGLGPLIEAGADYATGGLYGLGKVAWNISRLLSLAAILGFSLSLWVRFFLKFNYHMWLSEAGHIYFERRMRKPQV